MQRSGVLVTNGLSSQGAIGRVAPILVLLLTGYKEAIVITCCWKLLVVVSGTCSHSGPCGHSSCGLSHYYSAKYA